MSELIVLIVCCVCVGWTVFDSTSVTIDTDEINKIGSYCTNNKGIAKIKYTTDGNSQITCIDGAIFKVKGE
jgi:hypothetical protein